MQAGPADSQAVKVAKNEARPISREPSPPTSQAVIARGKAVQPKPALADHEVPVTCIPTAVSIPIPSTYPGKGAALGLEGLAKAINGHDAETFALAPSSLENATMSSLRSS